MSEEPEDYYLAPPQPTAEEPPPAPRPPAEPPSDEPPIEEQAPKDPGPAEPAPTEPPPAKEPSAGPSPVEPPSADRIRTVRADWWRLASTSVPGSQETDALQPAHEAREETELRARKRQQIAAAQAAVIDTATGDQGDPTAPEEPPRRWRGLGRWDPVAIAERMVRAHQDRPVQERVASLADAARWAKPRAADAVYTLSGVWVAWRGGLTPWLIAVTEGAPIGVSLGLVLLGWIVRHRSCAAVLPVAWFGQLLFTTTVIAAVFN